MKARIIKVKGCGLYIGSPVVTKKDGCPCYTPNYTTNIHEAACFVSEKELAEAKGALPLKEEALELINMPE